MEISILPAFIMNRLTGCSGKRIHLNILLSSFLVMLVFMLSPMIQTLSATPHVCLAQQLFHLPCPGCGVLSSLNLFFAFDPFSAWQISPAGVLFAVFLLAQIPLRIYALAVPPRELAVRRSSRWMGHGVLTIMLACWLLKLSV